MTALEERWATSGIGPVRRGSRRARGAGPGLRRRPAPGTRIARLSPLKHRNLNLLGRYSFTASTPAVGALRPLRDPDAPELDEDDDGGGQD
ncbi:hypothetical protein [Streptomyces sp. NPDC058612]|uniref:hypothetical protein n=1 Tax=Streptomyces sp. NPDC058612 TaxID=3346555 RepID=UPI00365B691A